MYSQVMNFGNRKYSRILPDINEKFVCVNVTDRIENDETRRKVEMQLKMSDGMERCGLDI